MEEELERLADLRRRYRATSHAELLAAAAAARSRARRARGGRRPGAAAAEALAVRPRRRSTGSTRPCTRRAPRPRRALAQALARELAAVGLRDGGFRVELRESEPGPRAPTRSRFAVRPNAGLPFRPLSETASGGELSRVALAIAAVAGGETMVFDEIDAGIGGTTAHAVGETLRRLAEHAQVITITHLPQIASLADRHFRVEKVPGDPTHTRIEPLAPEERREELERMLGGADFLALLAGGEGG